MLDELFLDGVAVVLAEVLHAVDLRERQAGHILPRDHEPGLRRRPPAAPAVAGPAPAVRRVGLLAVSTQGESGRKKGLL